ncbi:MAG TPA: hypothetical protein VD837_08400 [Terriglobales bacterium]|nr:hypothetical protein [Terriglobales bacterium]
MMALLSMLLQQPETKSSSVWIWIVVLVVLLALLYMRRKGRKAKG